MKEKIKKEVKFLAFIILKIIPLLILRLLRLALALAIVVWLGGFLIKSGNLIISIGLFFLILFILWLGVGDFVFYGPHVYIKDMESAPFRLQFLNFFFSFLILMVAFGVIFIFSKILGL